MIQIGPSSLVPRACHPICDPKNERALFDEVDRRILGASYKSSNAMVTGAIGSYTYDATGNMLTNPDGTAYS